MRNRLTHCRRGHELTPANTYEFQYRGKLKRFCKICAGSTRRERIKVRRDKARRGPMRSPAYRRWCREQACSNCGGWPTDAAHSENNGTSSKGPDSSCAPLCRPCHDEFDKGRKAFQEKHQIDMKAVAATCYARFIEQNGEN